MKKLHSLPVCLFISFLFVQCSKDSDCLFFGGKWCYDTLGLLCIEFRSNGEYYSSGTHVYNWQAKDDCKIVEFYNPFLPGVKAAEGRVVSINDNKPGSVLIFEQAGASLAYTKQ